jgi:sodium transport system permease protein
MKPILTIFKKEFKDITRDRRSMRMMFIIPMLLFPLLFTIAAAFTTRQTQKVRTKTLEVALITQGNAEAFREILLKRDDLKIREDIAEDIIPQLIRSDSIDAAIRVDEQFDAQIADLQRGQIHLYFKSSRDMDTSRNRLTSLIRDYENQIINDRFQRLALDRLIVDPVQVRRHDIASQRERIGKSVGGFFALYFCLNVFYGLYVSSP